MTTSAPPAAHDVRLRRLIREHDVDAIIALLESTCAAIASAFYAPGLSADDLIQEARIGLAKAVRDFRGTPDPAHFNAFAALCIRRQVITAVRAARGNKHLILSEAAALDAPIDDYGTTIAELVPNATADLADVVQLRWDTRQLLARFDRLTPREREAAERHWLAGEPYSAIGPDKSVDNALQRARRKLATDVAQPRRIYVDRDKHPSEREAIAAAMRIQRGRVISIAKRKVIDGRERAPQGRPDRHGRLGKPVWRIEILTATPIAA
jgi:RNA polymerase sporulation-specific sigma factor